MKKTIVVLFAILLIVVLSSCYQDEMYPFIDRVANLCRFVVYNELGEDIRIRAYKTGSEESECRLHPHGSERQFILDTEPERAYTMDIQTVSAEKPLVADSMIYTVREILDSASFALETEQGTYRLRLFYEDGHIAYEIRAWN